MDDYQELEPERSAILSMNLALSSEKKDSSIRIVIADDTPSLRDSLVRLINRHPDLEVVGQAANGKEALQHVEGAEPDILLLDIEMPVMNGLEVTRRLFETGSKVKILVLSAYDDPQFIDGVRSFGASGYLLKERAMNGLPEAIRRVARGENLFPDPSQ
jgi:DNA-binding NarL/FixJ family response regulator